MSKNAKQTGFRFKQFHIAHEGCAMKVGTDAILLGAWTPVVGMSRILDIGTGSGIISLMLVQRGNGNPLIDAIDIDTAAISQTQVNVAQSPWPNSINGHAVALQDYQAKPYDLLISNPPFFTPGQTLPSQERQWARHSEQLPHDELLKHARRLSHSTSKLTLVLPLDIAERVSDKAPEHDWYLSKSCTIYPNPIKAAKRQLILLERSAPAEVEATTLTIRATDGTYSAEYCHLCRDFYLKM